MRTLVEFRAFSIAFVFLCSCSSHIHIQNNTPKIFSRTPTQIYPLVLKIKDTGIFKRILRAYAVVGETEYPMEKKGDEFVCDFKAPCIERFSVRYKIVYLEFPSEREYFTYEPESGAYEIKIDPTDDISVNTQEIVFDCSDSARDRCISDYVMIHNNTNSPVTIQDIQIAEDDPLPDQAANYRKQNAFGYITNAEKLPKQIDCGQVFWFVVCFNHKSLSAQGVLTVLTSHQKQSALKIRLSAKYWEKKQTVH